MTYLSQNSTTFTPVQEHFTSELPVVPGDPEDNTYGQAAPFQTQFSGQGLSDYQDTLAGEAFGALASGGVAGSPLRCPYSPQHVR